MKKVGISSGDPRHMHKAELKVHGGKLIRVKLSMKKNKISDIRITGDFFLHPEDGIEELERRLKGVEVESTRLYEKINGFFNENNILIGAKPDDFIKTILLAIE